MQNILTNNYIIVTLVGWLLASLVVTQPACAQQAKGYVIGDIVGNFGLKNTDDRTISLNDYRGQKGVIVVFTSNHCPFSKAYEDRLLALDRKFASQGYPVLAIMSNDPVAYEDDSFDRMKARARERNYTFAYLMDDTQAVARAFGATRTPQAFVLKQTNGQFAVQYIGSIDDNPQDAGSVQRRYVEEAITSLLTGRAVSVLTTKAVGCAIKWKAQ